MDIIHLILLGFLQGLTEFLPVSSSAHLILLPLITKWQDQGLAIDIAAHSGTLLAVIIYFQKDLKIIISNGIRSVPWHDNNINAQLFWCLIFATVPIAVVGFLGRDFISEYFRNPLIIAFTTIFFGILLWFADIKGKQNRNNETLRPKDIVWIGLAQILALIPGTSRSGITITAGLMLGLNRKAAARFSFLLSIPVIFLAGGYEVFLFGINNNVIDIESFIMVFVIAWLTAWITISLFLRFIEKTGVLPYVIYRLLLGGVLLYFFL